MTIARSVGNVAGQGLSLSNLGLVAASRGKYNKAIKHYKAALVFRRRVRDPLGEANTLNNLGDVYQQAHQFRDALHSYYSAQILAKDSRDTRNRFRSLQGLVYSNISLGRIQIAFRTLNDWVAFAHQKQDLVQELTAVSLAAQLYHELGDKEQAENFYHQAIKLAIALGDEYQEAFLKTSLSQAIYDLP